MKNLVLRFHYKHAHFSMAWVEATADGTEPVMSQPPPPTHTHIHGGGGLASWVNRHPMKCFGVTRMPEKGAWWPAVVPEGPRTVLLLQRHFENCNFTRPQYRRLQGLHSLFIYNFFHFMTLRSAEVRPLRLRFWSSFNVIMSNAEVIVTLFHLVS